LTIKTSHKCTDVIGWFIFQWAPADKPRLEEWTGWVGV